jgi:hypothetical protein
VGLRRAGLTRPSAESGSPLLDGADPLLVVEAQEPVRDDAGGLLERRLGLLDQVGGPAGGPSDLRAARVERGGPGRVRVGEALPAALRLAVRGAPGAGVEGVGDERGEGLRELGDPIERVNG